MLWDIFCRVIDNFGDIGVCWRLSADLAQRGQQVRLWTDDDSALEWLAPGANSGAWPHIRVMPWHHSSRQEVLDSLAASDVWVEAFGCEINEQFIASFANRPGAPHPGRQPAVWLNLEYLSAESYVERCHALPSPVMNGPAKGWTKHFFYPGFSPRTGGLIREPDLAQRQQAFEAHGAAQAWLRRLGVDFTGASTVQERLISLFCYEPAGLPSLLETLAQDPQHHSHLLVTPGRAAAAVQALLGQRIRHGKLRVSYLPRLTQVEFDQLLWHCDINFVRGEDSLVRAIWAGKPLVWQVYPQDDDAHLPKLHAFLARTGASAPIRVLHDQWNGIAPATNNAKTARTLILPSLPDWQKTARALKSELQQLPDLSETLIRFVHKNR